MNLNLLLRHPTYNSLYDLYVYKLNATDRDAWQHDKRDVDFFATDYGIKGIDFEQGIRHYSFDAVINLLILRTFCGE